MTRAMVNPGICGMTATIEVAKISKRLVSVEVISDCEKVAEMSESLPALGPFDVLKPQIDSKVYQCAAEHHLCASCFYQAMWFPHMRDSFASLSDFSLFDKGFSSP